ncbi:MAG: 50S ribosomal protein L6 [Calditrichales bacterium]|nr:MAG: 50S ribosomal protein L6 [Calditrichales bacterium]
MSRIGKLPISIPAGVEVSLKENYLVCKGLKGELSRQLHPEMIITLEDNEINVSRPSDGKSHRSLHGLTRSLVANMVEGVSVGYTRTLEIIGVGYKAELKGNYLALNLGYSHQIVMSFPETVAVTVSPKQNEIVIHGPDKELVGSIAAKIRSFKKPEPYKGKGVRYAGEFVRRKAGKTGA